MEMSRSACTPFFTSLPPPRMFKTCRFFFPPIKNLHLPARPSCSAAFVRAAAVVVAFFLCWAPFHAQRLLYLYAKGSPYYAQANELLYTIAGCFYYFSSTVNPILYNVMSMKYRRAFRETLCGYSGGQRRRNRLSRDLQSSFRDTIVPLNTVTSTAECRTRTAQYSRTAAAGATDYEPLPPLPPLPPPQPHAEHDYCTASPPSAAADVLVMISPTAVNGNAQCYKSLLKVTVQGANRAGAQAGAAYDENPSADRRDHSSRCFDIETCI